MQSGTDSPSAKRLAQFLSLVPRRILLQLIREGTVDEDQFGRPDFARQVAAAHTEWAKLRSARKTSGKIRGPAGRHTSGKVQPDKTMGTGERPVHPPDLTRGWRVGWFDSAFPPLLKEIPDPPLVLYGLGNTKLLSRPGVAIVGARRSTRQGRELAQHIAGQLATRGVTVVSGLALGIDGAAHRGAVAVGGPTIAVLGSGLGHIYPAAHQLLVKQLLDRDGTVISEYPPHLTPRPHHFLERNRLISGLCLGTLVVEAGDKSGSLRTASYAGEQGREVMAVPGPVASPVSQGCHRLIQQGAALVTNVEDVIDTLTLDGLLSIPRPGFYAAAGGAGQNSLTDKIKQALRGYPKTVDELMLDLAVEREEILPLLAELELAGIVVQGSVGYIAAP